MLKGIAESDNMKKITNIGLIIMLVIIAVFIGIVLSIIFPLSLPSKMPPSGENPPKPPVGDFQWFYTAKTVISIVNITLIIVLLIIYIEIYRKIKSKFTIGLITVMLVLLFYAITSNPLLQVQSGFRAGGLGPFAMLPDLFATIALTILLYLSLE